MSPARVKNIVDTARRTDGNFLCHKSTRGATRLDRLPHDMTCRGFHDSVHLKDGTGQALRIIGRMGGFKEVELTEEEIAATRAAIVPYHRAKEGQTMTRQKEIPGTERVKIPEVEAAAGVIRDQLKKQARAAKKIKETKPSLIAAMRKAGIQSYRDDEAGFVVTINDGPVKVEITDVDDKADDDDEAEVAPAH